MDTHTRLSIGNAETHAKGWGEEVWIINNDKYCGKLLKFNKGASFSDHYHINKDEAWYVLEGKLELRYYNLANADRIVTEIRIGSVVHVPPNTPHQLIALEPSTIIEVSTPHDEMDSYRIGKGDSQRGNKKYKQILETLTNNV
ncbi:MAG: cupin domain-containing protein [bacterium]|nr:cupin domain-containing protein [bacterium]